MSLLHQAPSGSRSASEAFSKTRCVAADLPGSKAPPPTFHLIKGQRGSKRPFSFLGNWCKAVSDCRAGKESRSKYGTEASKTTDSSPWQQAKSRGAKVLEVHEQEQQQLEVRERAGDQQAAEVLQKADCDPTN